jgi:hypothetical protein
MRFDERGEAKSGFGFLSYWAPSFCALAATPAALTVAQRPVID